MLFVLLLTLNLLLEHVFAFDSSGGGEHVINTLNLTPIFFNGGFSKPVFWFI